MPDLISYIKLKKNKRLQRKAGIVGDNGNLTDLGKDIVINLLADRDEKLQSELTQIAKEWLEDETE